MSQKILSLKRWTRATYEIDGGYAISMDLKRLRFDEANTLLAMNMQAMAALGVITSETKEGASEPTTAEKLEQIAGQAEAAKRFCAALKPDVMKWVWEDCIRSVAGLESEDGPVTDGPGLAAFADQRMVLWLLMELQSHSALTAQEGKASSSPSTSGSEGQTPSAESGASPVSNTGSDGQVASIATGN